MTNDDEPRWLTAEEQRAWVSFVGVLVKLPSALDADMRNSAGLSHFEYSVLSELSETAEWMLPMSRLAELANASLSRLSHVLTRMEKRGWIERLPCPENRRVTYAKLTKAGFEILAEAAPGHVETVRTLLFDALSPTQVKQLATISNRILTKLDPAGEWPPAAAHLK
jgi:DNA-binding MarR family transcriptional regulator